MFFPHYQQHDAKDCGPTCLRIISKYYGKTFSIQEIRSKCSISREGVSLLGISDAAESIGYRTVRAKITWEQLLEVDSLPCIVHWNHNHFVVLYKIACRHNHYRISISDPALGLLEYSKESFLQSWIGAVSENTNNDYGVVLFLEPSGSFYSHESISQEKGSKLSSFFQYLRPHKKTIVQLLISMLIASLLSLILPIITQSIVDKGISFGRISFVKTMLVAQLFVVLGEMANGLIRNWLMLHMTARVSISLISDFLAKLMQLPFSFFGSRMSGDIMQRIHDHSKIQDFLTNSLLSMIMAVVMFVVYSFVLGGYNGKIFLIFVIGSIIYFVWVLFFLGWRRKLNYLCFQEASNNQSSIVQIIHGIQDIKLNTCEKQKRWEWEKIQAKLYNIKIRSLSLSQIQQVGGTFIDQTKNILISYMAAKSVIEGNMTLGMMTALQYVIGQLNAPVSFFISFTREYQDALISLERLNDVNDSESEDPMNVDKIQLIPDCSDIIMENVSFQYDGPHSPFVLKNFSLTIPRNKVTAIVGSSGSGKSTIIKLLLGFYSPSEGKISLGGVEINNYNKSAWRRSCGSVLQDGYIFSNTIAENIALCDDYPDMSLVRSSAVLANINEWIESLPQGYNTKIGISGHGISTGQKQRLLIARAAYKNAPYLFFDEATNSLDANNERTIMNNLTALFEKKTVLIVAHRLSTVMKADNIVVIDDGKIMEQGNHYELLSLKGYYYKLVKNQIE